MRFKKLLKPYKRQAITARFRVREGDKKCSLASSYETKFIQFIDFIASLNYFSHLSLLEHVPDLFKKWEYSVKVQCLIKVYWSKARVLNIGSELSPMLWFLFSLGTQFILVEIGTQWVQTWESIRNETGLAVDWHIVTGEKLSFANEFFDVITSSSVIEHQQDKKLVLD